MKGDAGCWWTFAYSNAKKKDYRRLGGSLYRVCDDYVNFLMLRHHYKDHIHNICVLHLSFLFSDFVETCLYVYWGIPLIIQFYNGC